MQISLAAQQIRSTTFIWVVTHHQYGISALIPHVENIEVIGGPKCWLFSQATTDTPFDFHIFIYYLQVDKLKLSNTSTTQPTEEKQANAEEEDNGTNKMQAQCSVIYFVIILLFILIIAISCPDWLSTVLILAPTGQCNRTVRFMPK